jgi:nucleotide-binding universal stress UspA family protein
MSGRSRQALSSAALPSSGFLVISNAKSRRNAAGDISISEVLLSRAADFGAYLIVPSAYHHSQLREALIGAVSRELLKHMTIPILLSH